MCIRDRPKPQEIGSILAASMDPGALPGLSRYLDDERLRRPYALLALQAAAVLWSPEELASAVPSESRRRLIEGAAASPDQRLANCGQAYLAVLGSVVKRLRKLDAPKRRDFVAGMWLKLNRLAESPVR